MSVREISPKVFESYGRVAFGMQATELQMRVALLEIISELEHVSNEDLDKLSFGQLVTRADILIGARHLDDWVDLRNYVANRNYMAHHFFIDFIRYASEETALEEAAHFFAELDRDSAVAAYRIATIAEAAKLPIHARHSERHDRQLMSIENLDPAKRVLSRKFGNA